ncbi:MAG: amidohydrolase family protein, partial [Actinomycetota bacterium]
MHPAPADHRRDDADPGQVLGGGRVRVRIGMVKAFLDGTLGARTAHMLEPYDDGGRGLALLDADAVADLATRAAGLGLP